MNFRFADVFNQLYGSSAHLRGAFFEFPAFLFALTHFLDTHELVLSSPRSVLPRLRRWEVCRRVVSREAAKGNAQVRCSEFGGRAADGSPRVHGNCRQVVSREDRGRATDFFSPRMKRRGMLRVFSPLNFLASSFYGRDAIAPFHSAGARGDFVFSCRFSVASFR